MPSCYLAGPMRHKPKFNFPAFFRAERKLKELGWKVYNPAGMDVRAGTVSKDGKILIHDSDVGSPRSWRRFAKRDLGVLLYKLKAEDGDAIIMLPGWKKSLGARAENAVARWLGLRRMTLKEALR